MIIYPVYRTWISSLFADKPYVEVFTKYSDFANVFSIKAIVELSKHIRLTIIL